MSVEYQRMMRNLHPQLLFYRFLNLQKAWVTELHDGLRLQVDEVVVLAELVGSFVLSAVVSKLVLDDQAAVKQQLDGII